MAKTPKNPADMTPVETMAEAVQDATQETVATIETTMKSFTEKAFTDKFEMPEAAREAALRVSGAAKERFADLYANANNATVSYEKAVAALVNSAASSARSMLQATHDNALATFDAIEKLVAAKSVTEAYQIQSDFAREFASANWARVQNAADTVKANVQDGVKMLQDEAEKVIAFTKKAA
ncbi:phasin family protein [Terrarubrum flagellatum]|uniref:phasin family protein n=1 Tax=Terrirubrum flagellatum TaxID=2895980 RepID=UPI0031453A14